MQAQFESIFKELGAAAAVGTGGGQPSSSTDSASAPGIARAANQSATVTDSSAEASFQETIRRTMERMQTSGDQATAAAAAEGSDDFMAELLKQMQGGEGGLEGSEEEFSKMLLGMMEQLTNKDILYEPMKELNDKLPEWMEKNRDKIPVEDRKRYELQEGFVKEIVAKFEESTYADSNPADREYIVERMQKVSSHAKDDLLTFDMLTRYYYLSSDASCWFPTAGSGGRHAFCSRGLGRWRPGHGVLQPPVISARKQSCMECREYTRVAWNAEPVPYSYVLTWNAALRNT